MSGTPPRGGERLKVGCARKWGRARPRPSQQHLDSGKKGLEASRQDDDSLPAGQAASTAPRWRAVSLCTGSGRDPAPNHQLAELRPRAGGTEVRQADRGDGRRCVSRTVGLAGQLGQWGSEDTAPPLFAGEAGEQRFTPTAGRAPHWKRHWKRGVRQAVWTREQGQVRLRVESGTQSGDLGKLATTSHGPTKSQGRRQMETTFKCAKIL